MNFLNLTTNKLFKTIAFQIASTPGAKADYLLHVLRICLSRMQALASSMPDDEK